MVRELGFKKLLQRYYFEVNERVFLEIFIDWLMVKIEVRSQKTEERSHEFTN